MRTLRTHITTLAVLGAIMIALPVQADSLNGKAIGQLRLGSTGDGVKVLQTMLAADPSVYPQGYITGYFGTLTQQAVKKYQKKYGIDVVGQVGPVTLKQLENDLSGSNLSVEQKTTTSMGSVAINQNKQLCVTVPPGHLIAPGWLKKNQGVRPELPTCQALPPGIAQKLGSTTPPQTDTVAPNISGLQAIVSTSSATVSWTTNELSTTQLEYGPTTAYGSLTTLDSVLRYAHNVFIAGLAPATTYYYRVYSKDAAGNIATSVGQQFGTLALPDTTAPVLLGISVSGVSSTTAIVLWTTNEPATGKVYVGTTTPLLLSSINAVGTSTLTISHSLILGPLNATTTYQYLIVSTDAAGNTATSSQMSFTTTAQ